MSQAITLQALSTLPTVEERVELLMKELNPGQRLAAMTLEGPVAAIAGAGAGKTKTMITRTAHLLVKGVPATSIMLVTFTNKGSDEIKTRLEAMVGPDAQYITAGTFHSIIFRCILKNNADHPYLKKIGIDMNECSIMDESDAESLLEDAIRSLGAPEQEMIKEKKWAKDITAEMAQARARGLGPEEYAREKIGYGDRSDMLFRLTHDTWQAYTQLCRIAKGIDFDDILVVACRFLEASPDAAKELAERFRYLMLDEYQDTNPVQMKIMDSIARHHENIFVVGDEKQSIYRFRGADINVILGFNRRYPHAAIIDMGLNYRSTQSILTAANVVAGCMKQRTSAGVLEKGLNNDAVDRPVALVCFESDIQEANTIAASIRKEMAKGHKGEDMAILYRSRVQKGLLERALVSSGISYQVVGDIGFYQRREVKNTIAFLRMLFRPWDSMAVLRVLKNTSFGVSDKSAKKAISKGQTAHAFLKETSEKTRQGTSEPTAVALKIKPLLGAMQCIRRLVAYGEDIGYIRSSVEDLWQSYMSSSVKRDAEKDDIDIDEAMSSRMQNVNFLLDRFFTDLKEGRKAEDIIDELSLMSENSQQSRDRVNQVKLMTIHASKGMEFPHVYMPGLDMDTTPGETEDFDEREEERRIFYVGMTRAMEKLVMTYAKTKQKYGKKMITEASPFFMELSRGLNQDILKYQVKNANHGPSR